MHEVAFAEPIELGDGLTHFRFPDGSTLALDIVGFQFFYSSLFDGGKKPDGKAILDAIRAHVAEACGLELGYQQADDLLHAVMVRAEEVRSFREARFSRARNSGST